MEMENHDKEFGATGTVLSTKVSLVLSNGTTPSGHVSRKSVDVCAGHEMKNTANYSPSYALATAVKALYSEPLLQILRTQVTELTGD